jgi:hypothetical protein
MGCDIHWVFQKKAAHGWVDVPSEYDGHRHYYLFAMLAGVRNNFGVEPISEPRGLPKDFAMQGTGHGYGHPVPEEIADEIEKRYPEGPTLIRWMGDHSLSWLAGEEMLAYRPPDDHTRYFFDEVRRLQDEHGSIRFVFGFDN